MKLLYCSACGDVFKLSREMKSCGCGSSRGRYLPDGHEAVVEGYCHVLGISNPSLFGAVSRPAGDYTKDVPDGEYGIMVDAWIMLPSEHPRLTRRWANLDLEDKLRIKEG